eukprot:TRINITY_DN10208_c0_g1_i2.p1 TRINITY_DN10208_c0_g1~~TRINITY_DN10208_c0_g1_i2.p1  ORF type:complete len:671 (-),score=211.36 TRINITY_DN10208_c0_g1_i2:201-2189(-)
MLHHARSRHCAIALTLLVCMLAGGSAFVARACRASPIAGKVTRAVSAAATMATTLDSLPFDNLAVKALPVDPEERNFVRPAVPNACFSKVAPAPVRDPKIVAISQDAMDLLGLSSCEVNRPDAAEYLSGNKLFPGASPHAHCYCGHQFGSFSGQLGDGAAMYLGEVVNERGERWELQFKGAGPTPYSRRGDGRKVLRSSIREFLCSEAMHYLGIPTTRAASTVTSDTLVQRDLFYTGDVINERATVVLRIAPTFLRFGSFEIFKGTDPTTGRRGPSEGNVELLKKMLHYSLSTFFPEAAAVAAGPGGLPAGTLMMYEDVVKRTAELAAAWQCVGFTHGVLNTDNMSLLGLTIDYGPYGFMEHFDRDYVPNGSDGTGRYRYQDQPEICKWNLGKFLEALLHVLPRDAAESALDTYDDIYERAYASRMRAKLGLTTAEPGDAALFAALFDAMAATAADFTGTFRALIDFAAGRRDSAAITSSAAALASICATPEVLARSIARAQRIGRPGAPPDRLRALWALVQSNPEAVAAQFGASPAALVAELEGEMRKLEAAEAAAARGARLQGMGAEAKAAEDREEWAKWLNTYAARLSSGAGADTEGMRRANPAHVLRNWRAQEAIKAAEGGDFAPVRADCGACRLPFRGVARARQSWGLSSPPTGPQT